MSLHILNRIDPLRRQSQRGVARAKGWSPMDPPDAYAPPSVEPVPVDALHPLLRGLRDEHVALERELDAFEEAILSVQSIGYTKEIDARLRRFFDVFDREVISHQRREERVLFPPLRERLIVQGEHAKGEGRITAIDLMMDEHAKALQLAAVVVNLLGTAFRLPDRQSSMIVLDAALEQGKNLIELLRLHIFRENNVIFFLAHRLISAAEFDGMQSAAATARKPE